MKHQIKRFIVVAAVASIVPAVAFASTARMTGMNMSSDYVKDYTGMFTFISSVNSVGNLVYGEAGTMFGSSFAGDQGMGAVLPNLFEGRAGVWAIHMRHYNAALGQSAWLVPINGGTNSFGSFDPNTNTSYSESFDLMWGHRMGSANIGVRLNRQFESYEDSIGTVEGNGSSGRNVFGLGAGVGFDMNPNTTVEIGALFQSRKFDDGTTSDDGGTGYLVAARAWAKQGANLTVVPLIKLWSLDQSTKTGTTTSEDKRSGWQAGVAGNWAVGHDDLFVLGANVIGNKQEEGAFEQSETLMPNVFMALETHLNPWLTFRAGAQQSVMATYKNRDAFTNGQEEEKISIFTFMMGTTVKMGNVQFDAVLDPAFLHNPFAQLSGGTNAVFEGTYFYDTNSNRVAGGPGFATVFPQVSFTYTW